MIVPVPHPARGEPAASAEPDATALAGLLAWIAWNQVEAGCDLHALDDGATLVVATSALAHGFQLGWLAAAAGLGGPFLGYGETLDGFAGARRGMQWSATGAAPGTAGAQRRTAGARAGAPAATASRR